jgi:two-component system, OmpR family, sensor histidine kinase MtrB
MRGIRSRLTFVLVALVALTVAAIGIGVYAFVDASLRDRLVTDARQQANYDLSVLLPGAVPPPTDPASFRASGLPDAFALGGDTATIADFGNGVVAEPDSMPGALDQVSPELRTIVAGGELGYGWQTLAGRPVLIVGGRQGGPPDLYFVFEASDVETALGQLRLGLLFAAIAAVGVALVTARVIARGILRPVDAAASAARRIGAGDLAARVPEGGRDEFGRWGAAFNEMAASLASTVERLEAARRQNQQFVADVSHELRTPLTALVAEASIIEAGLDDLPATQRRTAELLVSDVRRLRDLVADLMEISRFDAGVEQPSLEPIDLGRVITAVVTARLPEAAVSLPDAPVLVHSESRRLDRILGNLLDNARRHAPGSPVEVAMVPTLDGVVVVVADRGPGVDGEALEHLFDRFYTADPARTQGSTGLGLAIAAEHAALLGGTLRTRRRPGGGLVFALTLPVTGSLPPGDAADTGGEDAPGVSEPTGSPGP